MNAFEGMRYQVKSFGSDCFGNCTGWRVIDTVTDKVVEQFVGDIYKPEQRDRANREAFELANRLNNTCPKCGDEHSRFRCPLND